jgi:Chalcone isomerase-like
MRRTVWRKAAIVCIAATAIFYWPGSVLANENEFAKPAELASMVNARSVGSARLTVWGFQVYDARLWAPTDFTADDYERSSFALEITYLRSFDSGVIADRSLKEMRGIGSMSEQQAAQWLAQMRKVFPSIAKGDRLVGMHKPGEGASFSMNGKPAGDIRDPEFARLFFGVWLSPQTSAPQLRRELLGLHSADKR